MCVFSLGYTKLYSILHYLLYYTLLYYIHIYARSLYATFRDI